MKKFLTLTLVFVMALSLAAPAMAYTTRTALADGVSPYTVDIYLVEHTTADNLTVNWLSMPPTDRGYAKNEIIAAIGTLTIPKDYNLHQDGYRQIYFKGANVSLNVTDNMATYQTVSGFFLDYAKVSFAPNFYGRAVGGVYPWDLNTPDNNKLSHWLAEGTVAPALGTAGAGAIGDSVLPTPTSGAETVKFLCFGKVTADSAKITFGLSRNASWTGTGSTVTAAQLVTDRHWGMNPMGLSWLTTYIAPAATSLAAVNNRLPRAMTGSVIATAPAITQLLVLSDSLLVGRTNTTPDTLYFVFDNPDGYKYPAAAPTGGRTPGVPGNLIFIIETGSRGVSQRLYMFPDGAEGVGYHVFVEPSTNELVFAVTDLGCKLPTGKVPGDDIRFGSTGYTSLRAFYDEYFEGKLGFTAYNRGNVLIAGDWTDLAAAAWDIKETVDIEPWTPYVSVPDNIVTDPPKTGEYSILGFVMIALAGAAAVVVKKVRA